MINPYQIFNRVSPENYPWVVIAKRSSASDWEFISRHTTQGLAVDLAREITRPDFADPCFEAKAVSDPEGWYGVELP